MTELADRIPSCARAAVCPAVLRAALHSCRKVITSPPDDGSCKTAFRKEPHATADRYARRSGKRVGGVQRICADATPPECPREPARPRAGAFEAPPWTPHQKLTYCDATPMYRDRVSYSARSSNFCSSSV